MKKVMRKTKTAAAGRTKARKASVKPSAAKKKKKAASHKTKKGASTKKGVSRKVAVAKQNMATTRSSGKQSAKSIRAPRQARQEVSRHVTDISLNAGVSPVRESARRAAAVLQSRSHTGARHH